MVKLADLWKMSKKMKRNDDKGNPFITILCIISSDLHENNILKNFG